MGLATVFQARMLPLVAVFVIIVAILLRDGSQFDFSCHNSIIAQEITDVKLTKKHKCDIMEEWGYFFVLRYGIICSWQSLK